MRLSLASSLCKQLLLLFEADVTIDAISTSRAGICASSFGSTLCSPPPYRRNNMRPFEMTAAAEVASREDDLAKAETLFKNGIEAYTRYEPDGVDYALGRYGAFLIEQGRSDDALEVLKLAIDQNTDIPRIWADYLGVLSDRRDLKAIQSCAERTALSLMKKYRGLQNR